MTPSEWQDLWQIYRWPMLAGFTFCLGLWVQYRWTGYLRRSRGLKSKLGGERAEKRARKLLQKSGFKIVERQPIFETNLDVDGQFRLFPITPDYLVIRNGVYFVVEVKRNDGEAIARASHRRQVIEYLLATGMSCLLVNMTRNQIQIIDFPE